MGELDEHAKGEDHDINYMGSDIGRINGGEEVFREVDEFEGTDKNGKKRLYFKIQILDGDNISELGSRLNRSFKNSVKYYKLDINNDARADKDSGASDSLRTNSNSTRKNPHHIIPGRFFYVPVHDSEACKHQKVCVKCHGEFPNFAMDAHMHIQSGNCAPMPLIWHQAGAIITAASPRRSLANTLGYPIKWRLIDLAEKETLSLGHMVVDLNDKFYKKHFNNKSKNITPMILMPMDMDLAHLEGYLGEPIYYGVKYKLVATKYDKDTNKIIQKELFPEIRKSDLITRENYTEIRKKYNFDTGKYYTKEEIKKAEKEQRKEYEDKGYSITTVTYNEERDYEQTKVDKENEKIDQKNRKIKEKNEEIKELNKNIQFENQFREEKDHKKSKSLIVDKKKKKNKFSSDGMFYYYLFHDGKDDNDDPIWKAEWLEDEECGLFENYKKQMLENEKAAIIHPFKIIPLFHYDPRRWQEPNNTWGIGKNVDRVEDVLTQNWDEPFDWIASEKTKGHYAGIKMYTSLGYKPTDYKPQSNKIPENIPEDSKNLSYKKERSYKISGRLPNLKKFYKRCEELDIPIMCHCTPEGMYNHERELFWDFASPDEKKEPYEGFFSNDKIDFYSDVYVSPMAWEKCLKDFPKLRLCIAHFMGLEWDLWTKNVRLRILANNNNHTSNSDSIQLRNNYLKEWFENKKNGRWIKKCLQLLQDYKNVYTDISFFIMKDNFNAFKWLIENYQGYYTENGVVQALPTRPDDKHTFYNANIRKKIMFGTDWYVLEPKFPGYGKFVSTTKKLLDKIDPGDQQNNKPSLWDDFSKNNSLRFYKLDKILDNYKDGLLKWNEHLQTKKNEYIDPFDDDVKIKWVALNFEKNIENGYLNMKKYFVHLNNQKKTKEKNEAKK